jgi:uncharacterized protein
VILIDVNLLIYATDGASSQNAAAVEWLDRKLNESAPVGLPWITLLGFLRLITNQRVLPHPLSMSAALQQVSAWLSCDAVWIPQPGDRHAQVLAELLTLPGMQGNLVTDAHLAALAIEHGLTLCSTDGDFARFPGLSWLNPLAA